MSYMASRHTQPLRYYVYVSDDKLDMLFEQIDQGARKRISAELKVDLKIASITLRQSDNPTPTQTAKLRIVERFIDSHHHVGNAQEPGREYFRCQMSMRWGRAVQDSVLFMGIDPESSTKVILGGSLGHVLGTDKPTIGGVSRSHLYAITQTLNILTESREKNSKPFHRIEGEGIWLEKAWHFLSETQIEVHSAEKGYSVAPPQQLEFLSIPLVKSRPEISGRPHIVLGTPLYVALARL